MESLQSGHGFQCHIRAALDCPFVVLEQDSADETACDGVVWKDVYHIGAALDFAMQAFNGIGAV